jgi:hypothetical protein
MTLLAPSITSERSTMDTLTYTVTPCDIAQDSPSDFLDHISQPSRKVAPWVDTYIHYRGQCPVCTGDARHRILDAFAAFVHAGDSATLVASEYGYPISFIQRIVKEGPYIHYAHSTKSQSSHKKN